MKEWARRQETQPPVCLVAVGVLGLPCEGELRAKPQELKAYDLIIIQVLKDFNNNISSSGRFVYMHKILSLLICYAVHLKQDMGGRPYEKNTDVHLANAVF